MKKIILTLTMILAICMVTISCTKSQETTDDSLDNDSENETFKVGLAMAGLDVPFSSAMVKGAQEAAAKYGIELDIQDCQWDANKQIGVVQNLITAGNDAIIIMQQSSGTLGEVCKEANQMGIPIIGINRMIEYDGVTVASNVLCDNVELGYSLAQACSEMLGGDDAEGKIGIISGPLADQIVQDRLQGIEDYMNENEVAWEIIDTQDGRFNKNDAIRVTTDWLTRFPEGEIDGAIVMEPYSAIGFSEVAQSSGRDELVGKVVCNDAPKEINEAIENGMVYASVRQDPKEQGYLSTEAAFKVLSGEKVEKWWKTPLPIITKENLDEYPPTW